MRSLTNASCLSPELQGESHMTPYVTDPSRAEQTGQSPPSDYTLGPTDAPLFFGMLSIVANRRGSWLCITHHCPHCRGPHNHTWTLNAPVPTHRVAHCWRLPSPFEVPIGYWIFPKPCPENEQVLASFHELMQRERRTAGPKRNVVVVSRKNRSRLFDGWLISDD